MTGILNDILLHKHSEVRQQAIAQPLAELKARVADMAPTRDFAAALCGKKPAALIAEVKRQSPTKGLIRANFDPESIAADYAAAGASAISVLTDSRFFGGHLEYLQRIRKVASVPLLRKDFIISEYQVYQSRVAGADALLLIVVALEPTQLADLLFMAQQLQLTPLVEVHTEAEMQIAANLGAPVIGINNRNLSTFHTSLEVTENLAQYAPPHTLLVSESGISSYSDLVRISRSGVHAALVGEALMRQSDIGTAVRTLLGTAGNMASASGGA